MGGGSTAGPSNPGGLTLVNSLGYDPSQPQGGGVNWLGTIGSGLSSFGKGMSGGSGAPPSSGSTPQLGDAQIYGQSQQPPVTIPQNNLLEALVRLLGGQ